MRGAVALLLAAAAASAPAGDLVADDSVFGIRGLGFLGRPVSARSAASAGAFALFDSQALLNPAALGQVRSLAGWAVGAPSRRRLQVQGETATLSSTRFPVFGFATVLSPRLSVGVGIGDYLDRTWSARRSDTVMLRDSAVAVEDVSRSVGGVSDLRLAAAYRLSDRVTVGAAIHALAGSTRLSIERRFVPPEYEDFADGAVTEFTGTAVSAGVVFAARRNLGLAASLRAGTRLTARSSGGSVARVALPVELAAGANYSPSGGVSLAATVTWAGWARAAADLAAAGEAGSRDVWSIGVGFDIERLDLGAARLPVRLGYRWRQLPFSVGVARLGEHAVSGGSGFVMAGGRATVDLGVERGTRTAGDHGESFTTMFVGVTVRP